ncbi:hypothetical protein [Chitinimonas lacunae]|uniref:DUF3617 family protein n=1 Tax=Chitinimonas lacunae TaxID=1963018 RepID=A0ABV8MW82_9NEIS
MTSPALALLSAALLVTALADDKPAKPAKPVQGVWQVTVKLQQSGLPIPALPKVARLCLSSAQAKEVVALTPIKLMPRFEPCQEIKRSDKDSKLIIDYRCNETPETLAKLEANYSSHKINGSFELFSKVDNSKIVYQYEGEPIGLCPDESAPAARTDTPSSDNPSKKP